MSENKRSSTSITIILASIILGGFYYAAEDSKQKSIERQLEMKLTEERRIEENNNKEKESAAIIKNECVKTAVNSATELYKSFCQKSSLCEYEEGTYLQPQYEHAYNLCLQANGL